MTKRIIKKAAVVAVPGAILYGFWPQPIVITVTILIGAVWVTITELKPDFE